MHEIVFLGRVEAWGNEVKYRRRQSLRRTRYIHDNPVRAGLVANPGDWLYSSASNYEGQGGLIEVQLLDEMYQV